LQQKIDSELENENYMNDKKIKLTREEWERLEEEELLQEIRNDPYIANVILPEDMREYTLQQVRVYEAVKAAVQAELLSKEDKELIRLGKMYKKGHKRSKYFVLIAAIILAMSIGITSLGDAEKIFRTFTTNILNREQLQVDSEENVEPVEDLNEAQFYEKVEEKFGFPPVRLEYLPEWTKFMDMELDMAIPRIYMFYGQEQEVKISYIIRPNYKEGSWGKDIEDKLLEEYEKVLENTTIYVKKYLIEDGTVRWLIGFEYENVNYSVYVLNEEKAEIEKIINGLYFF